MVVESRAGKTPNEIAVELHCHAKTVRNHLARFNAEGIDGLGMRAGAGRKPRLTEQERSRILALVKQPPLGKLERDGDGTLDARDEEGSAQWSLDALTEAAHAAGIQVERSQIRRMYLREGKRWRRTHRWGTSDDKDFAPKRLRSSPTTPSHQRDRGPKDGATLVSLLLPDGASWSLYARCGCQATKNTHHGPKWSLRRN